jgi:hypothetical protein
MTQGAALYLGYGGIRMSPRPATAVVTSLRGDRSPRPADRTLA